MAKSARSMALSPWSPWHCVRFFLKLDRQGTKSQRRLQKPVPPFLSDTLSRIAEDLKRIAQQPGGYGAGYGQGLYDFFLEVLKTHMGLKRALLDRFTTRQKADRFRGMVTHPRIAASQP